MPKYWIQKLAEQYGPSRERSPELDFLCSVGLAAFDVRVKQKEYFAKRNEVSDDEKRRLLEESKAAEKRLDDLLKQTDSPQESLF